MGPQGAEESVLFEHPSILCTSAAYKAALAVQIVILVAFVVALPLAIFYLSRTAHVHATVPESFTVRWGALYQPFTSGAYFYQPIVLVRRAVYSGFDIGFATLPAVRGVMMVLVSVTCLIIHLLIKPYRVEVINVVESCSLLLHIVLASVVSPFPMPYSLTVEIFIFTIVVVPSCLFVGWQVLQWLRPAVVPAVSRKSISSWRPDSIDGAGAAGLRDNVLSKEDSGNELTEVYFPLADDAGAREGAQ
jgi:hypothetical protein